MVEFSINSLIVIRRVLFLSCDFVEVSSISDNKAAVSSYRTMFTSLSSEHPIAEFEPTEVYCSTMFSGPTLGASNSWLVLISRLGRSLLVS
jgi:hypothetical protein